MKTSLLIALLVLPAAAPFVLIADILGIPVLQAFDAIHALMLYLGICLSLIAVSDYEDRPAHKKHPAAKAHAFDLHLLTWHRG